MRRLDGEKLRKAINQIAVSPPCTDDCRCFECELKADIIDSILTHLIPFFEGVERRVQMGSHSAILDCFVMAMSLAFHYNENLPKQIGSDPTIH